jgi:hypothetical protein
LPTPLVKAARRFETWRRNRTTRRIPEELWSLAAELGARYGLSRTARALRVQYYDLKKRVGSDRDPAGSECDDQAPSFVEILTAPSAGPSGFCIEFEQPGGARMRIEMEGADPISVVELSRLFLEQQR